MSFMEIDLAGLDRFEADIQGAAEKLPRETRWMEAKNAGDVVETARRIAGRYSTKVAATVRAMRGLEGAAVQAGGANVPIAGLWEYGNKGGGSGDTFTHPVWGDESDQVSQPRHPFVKPAIDENEPRIIRNADVAVDRAFGPYGLLPNT